MLLHSKHTHILTGVHYNDPLGRLAQKEATSPSCIPSVLSPVSNRHQVVLRDH